MEFILLFVGLVLIVKSSDILIESTSKIARKYGVSTFVIGITVIAFGTSAPELVVGIVSSINKTNQLTLGTVIGSSYANLALIIGISAIIFPLDVKDSVGKREIPMLILVQCILAAMVLADSKMTMLEGILLLIGFAGFIAYIIVNSKKTLPITTEGKGEIATDGEDSADENTVREGSLKKLWVFSLLSLVGLYFGGKLSVDSSVQIATNFGLSETIIGLTIVAVGTSLPELVTSIIAVRKKEPDMVLGNCVGSNIFNTLLVLGMSAAISPFSINENMTVDVLLIILLTALVFVFSLFTKKISRLFGVTLVMSYFAYICFNVITVLS